MAESFIVASEFTVAAALWAHKSQIFKLDSAIVDRHGNAVGLCRRRPGSSWTRAPPGPASCRKGS